MASSLWTRGGLNITEKLNMFIKAHDKQEDRVFRGTHEKIKRLKKRLLNLWRLLKKIKDSLPPPCVVHDHIHLLPFANLVNVKPYHYPHFQKQEIEKYVVKILATSLIKPSSNLFSSLVFPVHKKDVKDRFPMPTIDELLDELYGAHISQSLIYGLACVRFICT